MATTTMSLNTRPQIADPIVDRIASAGLGVLRYGLAGILLYLGAFKFTAVEAQAIQPLIANSPLMGWLYAVMSVQAVSNLIGATEILIGAFLAARVRSPKASGMASLTASGMFLVTLSFLASTPGVWQNVPGFPLPVPNETGAFLLKDVFLLGAAFTTAAEALRSAHEAQVS